MLSFMFRPMEYNDWQEVRIIYEQGIETGNATVETESPSWNTWDNSHHKDCRIVVLRNNKIIGWAALGIFSPRTAYNGVGEVSIYISQEERGKGIGRMTLLKLIESSEESGFWTLTAKIFTGNEASIHLHLTSGFREVGTNYKLGKLNGIWRDVVSLERRSETVGID